MSKTLRKLKRSKDHAYGSWAGNPKGFEYNPERCKEEVWANFTSYQCSRPKGHGPGGLYCKQHGKMAEKRIREK